MTFKEKLQREHPECVYEDAFGGCEDCPGDYGYEKKESCISINEEKCRKCWDRVIPEEEDEEMIRDDLENGMVCELRNGELTIWLNGRIRGIKSHFAGTGYDLKNILGYSEYDIVRVYRSDGGSLEHMLDKTTLYLIWERKEPKEMTLEDIERELGYPVKIVSAEGQEA